MLKLLSLVLLLLAAPLHAAVVFDRLGDPVDSLPGFPSCPVGDSDSSGVSGDAVVYRSASICGDELIFDDGSGPTVALPSVLPGNVLPHSLVSGPFGGPSIDGSDLAIRATDVNGDGIWIRESGVWTLIAKKGTTTIPDSGGAVFGGIVTSVGPPRLDAGRVVFSGFDGLGLSGIYVWESGVLSKVVDNTDTYPGGSTFTEFRGYAIDGARVYFTAEDGSGNRGLLYHESGSLTLVADTSSSIPGGSGTFVRFWLADADGGEVAFVGENGSAESGLYLWDGSTLQAIVNPGDPSPGSGVFGTFNGIVLGQIFPSIDAGRVAFVVNDGDGSGLFLWNGSTIERLATVASTLLGDTVTLFQMKPDSLSGNTVVFYALTSGGSRTYRGTFPPSVPAVPPAAVVLLGVGIVASCRLALARR